MLTIELKVDGVDATINSVDNFAANKQANGHGSEGITSRDNESADPLTEVITKKPDRQPTSGGTIRRKDSTNKSKEGMSREKHHSQNDLRQKLAQRAVSRSPVIIGRKSSNSAEVELAFTAQRIRTVIPPLPTESPQPSRNPQIQKEIARLRRQRKVGSLAERA
jgi:hypothetical protein